MRAPFIDPLLNLEILNKPLPLLGRDMEMGLLRSVLAHLAPERSTGAHAVIISGEAGVGKSRLLEEFCLLAREWDSLVLIACAYESGWMFPYLPFIEALRPLIRTSTVETLRRYVGLDVTAVERPSEILSLAGSPMVAALCQLFPELSEKLQIPPAQEFLSSDQEKFRLFDAVATLLERVAQEQPVVLCLDNLQWADSATLELMVYLTVRLHGRGVALAGAMRPPQITEFPADTAQTKPNPSANALKLLRELMSQKLLLLLPLGPLSEEAAEQQLHNLLPGILSDTLAQSLLLRAGGNPFFLEELVRSLCLNEQLLLHEGVWKIIAPAYIHELPDRITLAVRQRIQGLACRELLQIAALFGREFPVEALAQVAGLSEEQTHVLVEEALSAMLVTRVTPDALSLHDPAGGFPEMLPLTQTLRFCQGIVQEVFTAEVPVHRRSQLHGEIGEALEVYYGAGASAHAAELARQYALGNQQAAALVWSLLAGEQALRQQAHREAIANLRIALKFLEAGITLPAGRATPALSQIYLALGESWLKLGELEQAANSFHQALRCEQQDYTAIGSFERSLALARANRLLADMYRLQGKNELALAHLQSATSLLDREEYELEEHKAAQMEPALTSWLVAGQHFRSPSTSLVKDPRVSVSQLQTSERLLLLQARAMYDLLLYRFSEAEKNLWQAHQLATEIGDRGSQASALHILGWLRGWGEHIGEAIRLIWQAHELYIAIGDPFHATLGDQSLGIIYLAIGEIEKARRYNEQGFARARRYGVQHIIGWMHCNSAMMALTQGAWEESESHFQLALEEGEKLGNARIRPLALQGQAFLSYRRGDWQAAERIFQEAIQAAIDTEWYPSTLALYGHFLAVTGCRAAAQVQLDLAAAQIEPFGYSGDFYIPFLAEGYLHLGTGPRATHYSERIRKLHGFVYYGVSVERILGEVAICQTDWQTAELAFEEGLALCRRSQNQPEEASILFAQARMILMRSGADTPPEKAFSKQQVYALCERARELFAAYKMHRDVDLINTLQEGLRQLEVRRSTHTIRSALVSPHLAHEEYQLDLSLTRRELEVLRLVAEGRTDREVANILILSPRTVNRHLSNIFVKLDVPGRAAAVAYAIRQRLVD